MENIEMSEVLISERQTRGTLTERIKATSIERLGYEMTQTELRLMPYMPYMPYMQYIMINEQKIDPNKVNQDERAILKKWKDKGWLQGGAAGAAITEEFWNILCHFVFMAYVDIDQ